jgi:hypothetical protein
LLALSLTPAWAQEASPDRVVAEWMLRMGGSVILDGQRRPITDLADLPVRNSDHTLISRHNAMGLRARDELKRLPPLPHLKSCMSTDGTVRSSRSRWWRPPCGCSPVPQIWRK